MENKILELFKDFCEIQTDLFANSGNEASFFFMKDEITITNPFLNEDGRLPVDPIEYYGDLFKNSSFYELYLLCLNHKELPEDLEKEFFEKEVSNILKNKDSQKAAEITEKFMDAGLISEFNDLLIQNAEDDLEQTMETIIQTKGIEEVFEVAKRLYVEAKNRIDNSIVFLDMEEPEESAKIILGIEAIRKVIEKELAITPTTVNEQLLKLDLSDLKGAAKEILRNKKLRKAIKKAKKEKKWEIFLNIY